MLVGTFRQADATEFLASVAVGAARFDCSGPKADLTAARQRIAAQLGACA